MFADEIRRAIDAADRIALPAVTALLWRAYGEGKVTDAEAEVLSGVIEARTLVAGRAGIQNMGISQVSDPQTDAAFPGIGPSDRPRSPRRPGVGSRPRTDASLERRRRWAASGRLPPGIASRFTLAEQAVLALIAAETARRGDCRLAVGHLAAIAGVSETTVRNAIREARQFGFVTVEERQITGFRNDTNVVRIVSAEWTAWLRLARKGGTVTVSPSPRHHRHGDTLPSPAEGGGCKSAKGTHTHVPRSGKTGPTDTKKGCRRTAGGLDRDGPSRIRAGGGAGRAMR